MLLADNKQSIIIVFPYFTPNILFPFPFLFQRTKFLAHIKFEVSFAQSREPEVGVELVEEASLLKRVAGLLVEVGDVGFTLTIRGVGERQIKLGIGLMCLMQVDVAQCRMRLGIVGFQFDAAVEALEGCFIVTKEHLFFASHEPVVAMVRMQLHHL